MTLIQLIVEREEGALDELPLNIRKDKKAVAETIENNLRKVIIEERPTNPKYFDKMSELLQEIIRDRKQEALAYEAYLKKVIELTKIVSKPSSSKNYPESMNSSAKRALYDNLDNDEMLAIDLDEAIRSTKKDGWRGNMLKEREIKYAVKKRLPESYNLDELFDIIKNQDEY